MTLPELPAIHQLTLARITQVPEWHPEHATFDPFPVHAWLVGHPDGLVLIDTGVGSGDPAIERWYRPDVTPVGNALSAIGVDIAAIDAVILSHLHFDHCGQQSAIVAPVYVQADEHEAARSDGYTVPEWAAIPPERLRLVDGDEEILDGITLVATPGHTPGHQSVVIEANDQHVAIAAQCAMRAVEVETGSPAVSNLHDPSWMRVARESLTRLRSFRPCRVHLSHDPTPVLLE